MQTSASPIKIAVPFADSGAKQAIPVASPGVPGRASFTTGFPAETMIPIASGGIAPYGTDFNGVLNAVTSSLRWGAAGGMYTYDAIFSAAIGGYPKGCMIASIGHDGFWISTVENNATNPDTGGAGWSLLPLLGGNYALDTGTANVYAAVFSPAVLTTPDSLTLTVKAKTSNTGASTFSPNGLASAPILGGALQPLQGGEIVANGYITIIFQAAISSWVLLSSTGSSPQVPTATKSLHALNLSQAQTLVANSKGATYVNSSGLLVAGWWLVDTTSGAITLTLPLTPATGLEITFTDAMATWAANPLTLARNGKTIMGLSEDLICNVNDLQFSIWYNGSDWRLV